MMSSSHSNQTNHRQTVDRWLAVYGAPVLLICGIGCHGQVKTAVPVVPATPAQTTTSTTDTKQTLAKPELDENGSSDQPADIGTTGSKEGANESTTAVGATADPAAQSDATAIAELPAKPEIPGERFLMLANSGPLVIEVRLAAGGEALDVPYHRYLVSMLSMFDANGDGKTSWDELTRNPRFAKGEFGTEMLGTEKKRMELIERNDFNRDKLVSPEEISRVLSREMMSSRAFTIKSSNDNRESTTRESPVRHLFDEDGDGQISLEEMDNAPLRLRSRDVDDDELIFPMDLMAVDVTQPQQMQMARSKVWAPDAAIALGGKLDWDRVFNSLQETYALGGPLDRDSFAGAPELFQALDSDENGRIGRKELESLLEVAADLVIDVDFEAQGGRTPKMTMRLTSESSPHQLTMVGSDSTRWDLRLSELNVRWECSDRTALDDSDDRATALVKEYDLNKDGYIDRDEVPDEVPEVATQFNSADEDRDEKIYPAEVANFLRRQRGLARYLVRLSVGFQTDSLFVVLDTNSDGRLDFREIQAASDRLRVLDANQDGRISVNEIPIAMRVSINRGETGTAAPADAGVRVEVPAAEVAPWFRSLDLNADGAVSRREFLGEPESFDALDANHDGFLEWSEVKSLAEKDGP